MSGPIIRPYGDTTGDGMVQMSFTLPIEHSKVADGAALQLANKMGMDPALVVHSKPMGEGFTFFNRMFFAQSDRPALILDDRSNGGGQAANYVIEVLARHRLSGWKDREGLVFDTPGGAI